MSLELATLEIVSEIKPHNNADKLELAFVKGYQVILKKDAFKVGDKVILIQPDSIIPNDKEWATPYLPLVGSSRRVRAMKLRGEWSYGLVVPAPHINNVDVPKVKVGTDFTELLGVTKYEYLNPVTNHGKSLKGKQGLPFGIPRTDEERYQNIDLTKFVGLPLKVTKKYDGSSFTAYVVGPKKPLSKFKKWCIEKRIPYLFSRFLNEISVGCTSRGVDLDLNSSNSWVEMFNKYDFKENLIKAYLSLGGVDLAVRGEVTGKGINGSPPNLDAKNRKLDLHIFGLLKGVGKTATKAPAKWERVHTVLLPQFEPTHPKAALKMYTIPKFKIEDIKYLQEEADRSDYEGFVCTVLSQELGYPSFKVMSRTYDEKKG
jgi:RNA ligase (TIGR02306 family)